MDDNQAATLQGLIFAAAVILGVEIVAKSIVAIKVASLVCGG